MKDLRNNEAAPLLDGEPANNSPQAPLIPPHEEGTNCKKCFDALVKNVTIFVVFVAYVVCLGGIGWFSLSMYKHYQEKYEKNYEASKERMLVHQMAQFYFNDKFYYNMHSFVSRTKHITKTMDYVGASFKQIEKMNNLASLVNLARSELNVTRRMRLLQSTRTLEYMDSYSSLTTQHLAEDSKSAAGSKTESSKPVSKPEAPASSASDPKQTSASAAKQNPSAAVPSGPVVLPHTRHPTRAESQSVVSVHPEAKPAAITPIPAVAPSAINAAASSPEAPISTNASNAGNNSAKPDFPILYRDFCNEMSGKQDSIEKLGGLVQESTEMLGKIGALVVGLTGFTENLLKTRQTLDKSITQYLFDNELSNIYTITDQDIWLLGWLLYSRQMIEDWQVKPKDMTRSSKNYEKLNMTDFLIVKDYLDDMIAQVQKKAITNDYSQAEFGFHISRGLFFNITSVKNITNCTNGRLVCPCAEGQTSKAEAFCQEKPKPVVQKKAANFTDPDAPEPEPVEDLPPVLPDQSAVDVITPYTALKSLEKNYATEPDLRSFGVAFRFIMGRYYHRELGGVAPPK